MHNVHIAKQSENDRTQVADGEKKMQGASGWKQTVQRAVDRERFSRVLGNGVPAWLRLGEGEQAVQRKVRGGEQEESKRVNDTGLPDHLKEGVEVLSGMSLDDVHVHYNSSRSADVQALAYTKGTEIHVGPSQEQHLGHEAWHVVQQKQGRVKPTIQAKGGVEINDDEGLEREADVMGAQAIHTIIIADRPDNINRSSDMKLVLQRKIKYGASKYLPANNQTELIERLVDYYGESNRDTISEHIGAIEYLEEAWSLFEVYRHFLGLKLPRFTEVKFGASLSKPTLPLSEKKGGKRKEAKKRYAAVEQFSFNTVTRLVGIVGTKKFEFRNDTDEELHAEEQFINATEEANVLQDNPPIVITINNSPCLYKCAPLLAKWVKRYKLTDVTIHFANPYGTDEEFSKAMQILQARGIKIHGFLPREHIGSDTDNEISDDYRDRFTAMQERLGGAKTKKLVTA